MKWHNGPTYQKISPSGLAGLLLVIFVVFGFTMVLGVDNVPALAVFYGSAVVLFLVIRIVIVKVVRVGEETSSLLHKTDEQLECLDEQAPEEPNTEV